jgi:cellobiose-specific phosphotransferase system component IIB
MIVQELKILRVNNSLMMTFNVPSGYTYYTHIEILYEDFESVALSIPLYNRTLLNDRFELVPVNLTSRLNTPYCDFLRYPMINSFWSLPEPLLPQTYWNMAANPHTASLLYSATLNFTDCEKETSFKFFKAETYCVVGDSQARHLANAMSRLIENLEPDIAISNITDKAISVEVANFDQLKLHPRILYFYDQYGEAIANVTKDSRCTITMGNFGQWPAGCSLECISRNIKRTWWTIPVAHTTSSWLCNEHVWQ